MASRFTYEIKEDGFMIYAVVYDNSKLIYTGNKLMTSDESVVVRGAKLALEQQYGPEINQMTKISSSSSTINSQSANSAQQNINNTQASAQNIQSQQQEKADELQKAADDKIDYLKNQSKQSSKDTKAKLAGIITPIILQFIRAENIADILIKKITKDVKKQLKNKGVLTIENGVFTFTPSNGDNYEIFKKNFDKKKANLEKTINTLKSTLDILQKALTFINLGLSLLKVGLKIRVKKLNIQQKSLIPQILAKSPTAQSTYDSIEATKKKIDNDQKKIDTYQSVITAINVILPILKDMLSKLQIRINQLQFIINIGGAQQNLNVSISDINTSAPENSEYTDSFGKNYTLVLVTLPNGQRQYQALDSYSKLKITQTAPSKIKTNNELFEEIKQIIG